MCSCLLITLFQLLSRKESVSAKDDIVKRPRALMEDANDVVRSENGELGNYQYITFIYGFQNFHLRPLKP